jgi:hypothetical protein
MMMIVILVTKVVLMTRNISTTRLLTELNIIVEEVECIRSRLYRARASEPK